MKEIYYTIRRFIVDIPWKFKQIYFFFQRGGRGYADCDVWNMDYYLVKVTLPMLKHLKKIGHGYPGTDDASTPEEWDLRLDEMINGFEAGKRVLDDNYIDEIQPGWFEEYKEISKNMPLNESLNCSNIKQETFVEANKKVNEDMNKFHEGMVVFNKWFFSLWD